MNRAKPLAVTEAVECPVGPLKDRYDMLLRRKFGS